MTDVRTAPRRSGQQLRLFHLENPFAARLGTDFFKSLPPGPGVYFFYDAMEKLLYIGQSGNLKARVGSYRHVTPEKSAKRTLRLVARTVRIGWQSCETAADAVAMEAALLLEHRPPFNRAGVWEGEPWWLVAGTDSQAGWLNLELSRTPAGLGPFPSAFRHMLGTFARCVFRALRHQAGLGDYPLGLMGPRLPLSLKLGLPEVLRGQKWLEDFTQGQVEELAATIEASAANEAMLMQEYWLEEARLLRRHGLKLGRLAATSPKDQNPGG
ncbi:nucleotide excision repair endonuclease [Prosthecobacter sp. SYSU 5D2]|uniref:nucleotide excision repair endonuclease n=1 Tax=Prosthecobacter sp. SYSU 5D2 TaxID=3134134 RepID=UPI0031FF2B5B